MAYFIYTFLSESSRRASKFIFSLSKDGLHWKDLHDGKPVICSEVGECGLRDPLFDFVRQTEVVL